jgi:Tol biopolymer transport system component
VRLTADPAEDEAAAWSPDGQRLAFASTREGGVSKVFVMNADGSGVARLTGPNSDTERWAAWAQ